MSEMQALEDWVLALLHKLEPQQRRSLNRKVAYALRRSQAQRIAAQQNPDGTAYQPRSRSKNLRSRKGSIKRKAMFARLRTQRYLKAGADVDTVEVGFRGRAGMIALVHQYGETHTDERGRRFVTPRRELLGLRSSDSQLLLKTFLDLIENN